MPAQVANVTANSPLRPNYPFSAVAGQASFKLALILVAIDPTIGGVLISGPRGSAKSTLARGLADIMPRDHESDYPFVTLPLGASEEKLLGSLNLQQVLTEKSVEFQEGLLAKADGGILYVDEVNLLQDNLVDLLLDVAASGENVLERDGISHRHQAMFILLGTMNPDEGELRPQLQDRFGLSVELDNQYSVEERIEIVRLRVAFDENQKEFLLQWADEQNQLTLGILNARQLKGEIECPEKLRKLIAEKCHEAGVDGLRADIVWYRAALAHSAWKGRNTVLEEDILAVEDLVLNHRRNNSPSNHSPSNTSQKSDQSQPPKHGFSRPPGSQNNSAKNDSSSGSSAKESQPSNNKSGDWGQMGPVEQRTADATGFDIRTFSDRIPHRVHLKLQTSKSQLPISKKKGLLSGGSFAGRQDSGHVDWFRTLISNVDWPPKHLRYGKDKTGQQTLHLVLLDTSGSLLQDQVFAKAKAVILKIVELAYLAREQLVIFGFGNDQVKVLLPKKRAPKKIRQLLDNISAGGGTPLREGLQKAYDFQTEQLRKLPQLNMRTYLITDGRTTQPLDNLRLLGDVVVVDSEISSVRRGKSDQIAKALGAEYVPLPV